MSIVWLHVLYVVPVVLYLSTVVMSSLESPSFVLPRLLFTGAVALLVVRRGGQTSNLKYSSALFYEIILTICVCNLALTFVWEYIENIIYLIMSFIVAQAEFVTGVTLSSMGEVLRFGITTLLASILLFWVLYSVYTLPLVQRQVSKCCVNSYKETVRFWSIVEVRFINRMTHTPESPAEEGINAPEGGEKNPVVHPPRIEINVD